MIKVLSFPGKYIQGPGTLDEAKKYIGRFGSNALLIVDHFIINYV